MIVPAVDGWARQFTRSPPEFTMYPTADGTGVAGGGVGVGVEGRGVGFGVAGVDSGVK